MVFDVVFAVRLLLNLMKEANTLRPNSSVRLCGAYLLENLESLRVAFQSVNEVPCLIQVISEAGGGCCFGILWVLLVLLLSLLNGTVNSSRQEQEK